MYLHIYIYYTLYYVITTAEGVGRRRGTSGCDGDNGGGADSLLSFSHICGFNLNSTENDHLHNNLEYLMAGCDHEDVDVRIYYNIRWMYREMYFG